MYHLAEIRKVLMSSLTISGRKSEILNDEMRTKQVSSTRLPDFLFLNFRRSTA